MKNHPNTPGFWMDYRDKVAEQLPGKIIKKGELDRLMCNYINDVSVEDCVAFIKNRRREELM